jgi:hypothetical protein
LAHGLDGRVFEFDLSQTFSTAAQALVDIPISMIVLSMTLPARASRATIGIVLELILLALIVRYAWTWH